RELMPAPLNLCAGRSLLGKRARDEDPAQMLSIHEGYEEIVVAGVFPDNDLASRGRARKAAMIVIVTACRDAPLVFEIDDARSGVDRVPPIIPDPNRDANAQALEDPRHHRRQQAVPIRHGCRGPGFGCWTG